MDNKFKQLINSIASSKPLEVRESFEEIMKSKISSLFESEDESIEDEKKEIEEHDPEIADMIENLSDEEIQHLIDELGLEVEDMDESEILDEISKERLGNYVKKAKDSHAKNSNSYSDAVHKSGYTSDDRAYFKNKVKNRSNGIDRAVDKLTKEETSESAIVETKKEMLKNILNKKAKKC